MERLFSKFHTLREKRDEAGFTLIELLVVILIIAILAAIAIPVFLKQREKGWVAQTESALKNAATAAESYSTGAGDGGYALMDLTALQNEGLKVASEVTVAVDAASGTAYCIEATHGKLFAADGTTPLVYSISSTATAPTLGACP